MRGLMGLDVNPVPVKTAVAMQGHCLPEFRLPLAPMAEAARDKLRALLESHGLLG